MRFPTISARTVFRVAGADLAVALGTTSLIVGLLAEYATVSALRP